MKDGECSKKLLLSTQVRSRTPPSSLHSKSGGSPYLDEVALLATAAVERAVGERVPHQALRPPIHCSQAWSRALLPQPRAFRFRRSVGRRSVLWGGIGLRTDIQTDGQTDIYRSELSRTTLILPRVQAVRWHSQGPRVASDPDSAQMPQLRPPDMTATMFAYI